MRFAICGLGRMGMGLGMQALEKGHEVVGADQETGAQDIFGARVSLSGAGISWAPVLIALFVSLGVVGVALFVLAARRRRSAESPAEA